MYTHVKPAQTSNKSDVMRHRIMIILLVEVVKSGSFECKITFPI